MTSTTTTDAAPDHLAQLRAINDSAAFNRWAGFEVLTAEPGRVELGLEWRDDFGQYAGFLHAGMTSAMLDTVCGFAAVTQVGRVMASNLSVCFVAAAAGERFRTVGEVVKPGRRQAFTRAELFATVAGGGEKLVATATTILVPIDPS